MAEERFKITPAVYLILEKDGQVLLLRRFNTDYEDGNYGLPAGHKEAGEYPTKALSRETLEEIGIDIEPENLTHVLTMFRIREPTSNSERVDLFYTAVVWTGEPKNTEPEKCDDLNWFPLDNPPINTIPYIRTALECYRQRRRYIEFGK